MLLCTMLTVYIFVLRSENEDSIPVVVHQQPAGVVPEPAVLGPCGGRQPRRAGRAPACRAGACGLAQGYQAVEGALL